MNEKLVLMFILNSFIVTHATESPATIWEWGASESMTRLSSPPATIEVVTESSAPQTSLRPHMERDSQSSRQAVESTNDQMGQKMESEWTPEITLHILSLIEQLHTKLATWEGKVVGLEGQIEAIRSSIGVVGREVNQMMSQLEQSEQRLGRDLTSSVEYLQDKIKLFLMESTAGKGMAQERGRATKIKTYGISTFAMRKELGKFSKEISNNVDESFNKFKIEFCAEQDIFENSNATYIRDQYVDLQFRKVAEKIDTGISDARADLTDKFETQISSIEKKLRETQVRKSPTTTNEYSEDVAAFVVNTVSPGNCTKGMIAISHALVIPGEDNPVTKPYLCDTVTDGGGWILIQKRARGNLSFYRGWKHYKNGFGSIYGDFWLGLDAIHNLTSSALYELRVGLWYEGKFAFAQYSSFSVDSEDENYVLRLGEYSGTAGDSLSHHSGMQFSTKDRDHDFSKRNCAKMNSGAWWYRNCHESNLNGQWGVRNSWRGLVWQALTKGADTVTYSEMKIRKVGSA